MFPERPVDFDTANGQLNEILNRIDYFYGRIDGTHEFPNSREGDLLKMVKTYAELLSLEQMELADAMLQERKGEG